MSAKELNTHPIADPEGRLESALIEEFLRSKNVDPGSLHSLPGDELRRLLTEASVYAAAKLAEVEARAHFVHEIHGKE
jgi:hypothetical protein